jgi:hypothetical protein
MWERGCFPATILERLRRPCRPRHPYAVPRAFLQCVCTRRRNCIAQLSPSREYALRTVDFPALSSATFELTHYATRQRFQTKNHLRKPRPQRTQSEQMSSWLPLKAHDLCRRHVSNVPEAEVKQTQSTLSGIKVGCCPLPISLLGEAPGKHLGSTDRASKLPQKDHFFGQRVGQPPPSMVCGVLPC